MTDGERIYAYFGAAGLYCFDCDGNLIWEKDLGSYKTRFGWGSASLPVLHDDRLFVLNDNEEQSFLVAFDKRAGTELWRVDRDEKSSWSTPFVWKNALRTEIVAVGPGIAMSYDLRGKELWRLSGMSSIAIPTPYAYDGWLYVNGGSKGTMFAVKPGASGDISLDNDAGEARCAFLNGRGPEPHDSDDGHDEGGLPSRPLMGEVGPFAGQNAVRAGVNTARAPHQIVG